MGDETASDLVTMQQDIAGTPLCAGGKGGSRVAKGFPGCYRGWKPFWMGFKGEEKHK